MPWHHEQQWRIVRLLLEPADRAHQIGEQCSLSTPALRVLSRMADRYVRRSALRMTSGRVSVSLHRSRALAAAWRGDR